MHPNQLRENEPPLELRKSKITKISDKTIEPLKNERKWKGNGSKLDPIIIERVEILPVIIKIHKSSLYYHIKNLEIDKLTCRNTQNITIENCTIKHLEIEGCYNFSLVNNVILKHKISFTKGSTFIDNKIAQFEKFKQNHFSTQLNPLGRQLVNPLTCCLYFLIISTFLSWSYSWFIGLILTGLLLYLNYSIYAKNNRIKDKADNIYVNNGEI